MARNQITDAGKYNRPARIDKPATYAANAQGGNANAGQWIPVCNPRILLTQAPNGRGSTRPWTFMQLYPTAKHWAEFRYRASTPIDASMTLVTNGQRYQIIDAIDLDMEHVTILCPLTLYQSKGTGKGNA